MPNSIKLPDEWLVIGSGSLTGSRFIELTGNDSIIYGAGGEMDKDNPLVKDFTVLDITNQENVEDLIKNFPGRYVINFAGATIVDDIEKNKPQDINNQSEVEQNIAYKVNVLGTRYLTQACAKYNKFPIFISTGFVFDGKNGPYSEDDPIASSPDDVCWYAWTKILAEQEVENAGISSITIRPSYPYRSEFEGKSDFARNFLNLFDAVQKGEKSWYPIFADQMLTPTFIDDFPAAVLTLVEKNATGVFHVTSPQMTTPYDFCCEVLRVARGVEHPEEIVPKGSLVEFQQAHPELAKRPLHGGEKTDKIQQLGFTPTAWKEGIQKAFGKTT